MKSLKFKYITLACFAVFFAAAQAAISGSDLINITMKDTFTDAAVHRGGGVAGVWAGQPWPAGGTGPDGQGGQADFGEDVHQSQNGERRSAV